MLERMTSSELSEWQAYDGFGVRRKDTSAAEGEATRKLFEASLARLPKRRRKARP